MKRKKRTRGEKFAMREVIKITCNTAGKKINNNSFTHA
jgi:hypothetical protein